MADWLKAIESTLRPSTFESYERNMCNHVVPYIGAVRLMKVDAGVLNGLYATRLATDRRPSSRLGKDPTADSGEDELETATKLPEGPESGYTVQR
jgi:Phage integrase, N-terminal SAM-like domain